MLSECTSSTNLVKFRSGSQLPLDFLEKKWVQILRRLFGPVHPGYFILGILFFPLSLFVIAASIWLWFFANPVLLGICIAAFAAGAAVISLETELKVPDIRLPVEKIRRCFEARDTLQGLVFLAGFVLCLALAALFSGLAALPVVLLFFVAGMLGTFLFLAVTSRVYPCVRCNRPAIFRRFRGNWTCVVCGNPR